MSELKKEDLIFTDTTEDIKNNDAILGTLEGPCADFVSSTRNGRHYSEALWEKTFNDPIVTELIEAGGIVGELDHPSDREETDSSRIAIIMREKPVKKNGKLWAKFDILNTPLGKIAYTLAKAGFKLGISSRGSGDVSPNYDGTEEVDEDTYDFKAFDLVLLPAVKSARLNLVTEGLDTNKFNYKKALLESIQSATEDEQKVMKDTLSNLNINLDDNEENPDQLGRDDITEESDNLAVDNDKAIFEELQNALKENKELANTITSLQEKLSVSYAKEMELKEEVNKYSKTIRKLSSDARQLNSLKVKISSLNEDLNRVNVKLANEENDMKNLKVKYEKLFTSNKQLTEQYSDKNSAHELLTKRMNQLKEQYNKKEASLNEQLADLQNTMELKNKEYSQRLSKANTLVEKYKSIANKAVDRYIESKALMLGVSKQEIKNKLSESYTFDEIDEVCESLKEYKLSMNNLPFRTLKLNENIQVKATPSKNENILPADNFGDEVDEQLMNLAGL